MREQLYQLVDGSYWNPSDASNRELGYLWIKFQRDFAEHFATRHDAVMRSHSLQAGYHEVLRSDEWWEVENLARISIFDPAPAAVMQAITRQLDELDCNFVVREALQERPFCRCSFGIAAERRWEKLPETLSDTIRRALRSYRETLVAQANAVTPLLERVETESSDTTASAAARELIDSLQNNDLPPKFSLIQIQVLQKALGTSGDTSVGPELFDMGSSNFGTDLAAEFQNEIVSV
jgi:hypothetical protein